jgi:hypothetical protein
VDIACGKSWISDGISGTSISFLPPLNVTARSIAFSS